jgi:penicillin-binding protein 2
MTYLFDPATALDNLHRRESEWGGDAAQRMAAKYAAYIGEPVAPTKEETEVLLSARVDAESRLARLEAQKAKQASAAPAAPAPTSAAAASASPERATP